MYSRDNHRPERKEEPAPEPRHGRLSYMEMQVFFIICDYSCSNENPKQSMLLVPNLFLYVLALCIMYRLKSAVLNWIDFLSANKL